LSLRGPLNPGPADALIRELMDEERLAKLRFDEDKDAAARVFAGTTSRGAGGDDPSVGCSGSSTHETCWTGCRREANEALQRQGGVGPIWGTTWSPFWTVWRAGAILAGGLFILQTPTIN